MLRLWKTLVRALPFSLVLHIFRVKNASVISSQGSHSSNPFSFSLFLPSRIGKDQLAWIEDQKLYGAVRRKICYFKTAFKKVT